MSWFTPNHIIILILAGLGMLLLIIYLRNLARVWASGDWSAVQGTIMESWIEESTTSDEEGTETRRYAPKVRYRYTVMGVEYLGDRIAFGPGRSGNRASAEKVLARYPKGSATLVYYDPNNPDEAVLERSLSRAFLMSGAVFIAVAIYLYMRWD
jgi:hypothetical protein